MDREDTRLLDTISRFLHKRWTDLKVKVASAILGALGIGGGVLWNRLAYSMWVFLASVLLLLLAVIGFAAVRHKHSRQCPSCKAHFALVEARGARAIDVDAADGTHRTTTRPYDCVNCGHRLERDSNEVLTEADED